MVEEGLELDYLVGYMVQVILGVDRYPVHIESLSMLLKILSKTCSAH